MKTVEKNVEVIANLEQEALHERSTADRVSDAITRFSGSANFVILHLVWFAIWIVANIGRRGFDPFPFSLLTMIVSLEAIFLSAFVLISQNRMTRQADKRAHLDLQINMLAEEEMTLVLRSLRRICEKLGVEPDDDMDEARELIKKTDPHELMEDLKARLPE